MLGEPFKVPETVEQATKQESAEKESIQDLRTRAMQLVGVTAIDKSGRDEYIESQGAKHLGHGMWARLSKYGEGKAWMMVTARNRAPVPVDTYGIELTERPRRTDWRLTMTCFPDDKSGDKLAAKATGRARCEVFKVSANDKPTNDALDAIGNGANVNIRVISLITPGFHISEMAVDFSNDLESNASGNARDQLTKAACGELGNCRQIAARATAEEQSRQSFQEQTARRQADENAKRARDEQSHRRGTLGLIGVFLLAAGFALRTSNNQAQPGGGQAFFTGTTLLGSFLGMWSGVAMAFDWYTGWDVLLNLALAAAAGLLLFIGLIGMGMGLTGRPERQTRLRLFAAGLGLLTPVYIAFVFFGFS